MHRAATKSNQWFSNSDKSLIRNYAIKIIQFYLFLQQCFSCDDNFTPAVDEATEWSTFLISLQYLFVLSDCKPPLEQAYNFQKWIFSCQCYMRLRDGAYFLLLLALLSRFGDGFHDIFAETLWNLFTRSHLAAAANNRRARLVWRTQILGYFCKLIWLREKVHMESIRNSGIDY